MILVFSWILRFEFAYLLTLFVTPKLMLMSLPQSFADMHSGKKIEFPVEVEQAIFCLLVSDLILENKCPFCNLFSATFFCSFALFVDDLSVQMCQALCRCSVQCSQTQEGCDVSYPENTCIRYSPQAWVMVFLARSLMLMIQRYILYEGSQTETHYMRLCIDLLMKMWSEAHRNQTCISPGNNGSVFSNAVFMVTL